MRGSQSNMKHRASIVSDLYSRSLYVLLQEGYIIVAELWLC